MSKKAARKAFVELCDNEDIRLIRKLTVACCKLSPCDQSLQNCEKLLDFLHSDIIGQFASANKKLLQKSLKNDVDLNDLLKVLMRLTKQISKVSTTNSGAIVVRRNRRSILSFLFFFVMLFSVVASQFSGTSGLKYITDQVQISSAPINQSLVMVVEPPETSKVLMITEVEEEQEEEEEKQDIQNEEEEEEEEDDDGQGEGQSQNGSLIAALFAMLGYIGTGLISIIGPLISMLTWVGVTFFWPTIVTTLGIMVALVSVSMTSADPTTLVILSSIGLALMVILFLAIKKKIKNKLARRVK